MGEQPQPNTMWMLLKNFSNKFSMPDFVNGNDKRGRKHISYDRIGTQDDDKSDFLSSSNPHLLDIVGQGELSQLDLDTTPPPPDVLDSEISDTQSHFPSKPFPSPNVNVAPSQFPKCLTTSQTTPSLSSVANVKSVPKPAPAFCSSSTSAATIQPPPTHRFSLFKGMGGGRSVDFNLKTKKFVFPNRVPSYQADQDKEESVKRKSTGSTNIIENVKDANWLEIEDDDDEESDDDEDGKGGDYTGASSCSSDYEDDDDEEDTRNGIRCGICGCEKKYEGIPQSGGGVVKYN